MLRILISLGAGRLGHFTAQILPETRPTDPKKYSVLVKRDLARGACFKSTVHPQVLFRTLPYDFFECIV